MPKAKRKQLNIGITPDQYEAVRIAAEEEEQTITVYCRLAIMEKAAPEPEIPDVTGLPTWLIHFLLFISRGRRNAHSGVLGGFAMQCRTRTSVKVLPGILETRAFANFTTS